MTCEGCGANTDPSCKVGIDGVVLCEACRLRFGVRHEYEKRLPELARRLRVGDFEGALESIHATQQLLSAQDLDGWVARATLADKALVLQKQGKWTEALEANEARLALPFDDASEKITSLLGAAAALRALGRKAEAAARVQATLDCLERAHPQAALPTLLTCLGAGEDVALADRPSLVGQALGAYDLHPPIDVHSDPLGALKWAQQNWRQ